MGDIEHDDCQQYSWYKNYQDAKERIVYIIILIDIRISQYHNKHRHKYQYYDDCQSPQRAPPAIVEKLAVGDVHVDDPKRKIEIFIPVANKEGCEETQGT